MRLGLVVLICAALALAAPGVGAVPGRVVGDASAAYALTDLGQPGEADSDAPALNDAGAVLVASRAPGGSHQALLWRDGAAVELGAPEGYTGFSPSDIDAAGSVAGTAYDAQNLRRPFFWRDGQWTDLGLPLGHVDMAVTGLGDGGHVVGWAFAPGQGGPRGFLWHAGTGWVDLGAGALPEDVDAAGRVAGSVPDADGNERAAVWQGGAWADLGVLAGVRSHARALNAAGQAAGWSTYSAYPFGRRAVLWRGGQVTDLGELPGLEQGVAYALNDAGHVVGTAYRDGRGDVPYRAFLWRDGAMMDLNEFLPPGSGWTLEYATGINARGQVVGSGQYAGQRRAFLLTPVALVPGPSPGPAPDPCDSPFVDVADGAAACAAIADLTSRGIIRGYATTPPTFGPADPVQRAQMAVFLVRALQWQAMAQDPRTFNDFGQLVGELRAASLILANACGGGTCVARGYGDGRFGPTDRVTHAQVVGFVARAFQYDPGRDWQPQPGGALPYSGIPASHADDARMYHHYAGTIPAAPSGNGWNQPAPRAWVALVLYQALQSAP